MRGNHLGITVIFGLDSESRVRDIRHEHTFLDQTDLNSRRVTERKLPKANWPWNAGRELTHRCCRERAKHPEAPQGGNKSEECTNKKRSSLQGARPKPGQRRVEIPLPFCIAMTRLEDLSFQEPTAGTPIFTHPLPNRRVIGRLRTTLRATTYGGLYEVIPSIESK